MGMEGILDSGVLYVSVSLYASAIEIRGAASVDGHLRGHPEPALSNPPPQTPNLAVTRGRTLG